MKFVIILACMLAAAIADEAKVEIPIVSQETNIEHDGNFHYSYESGDGTKANQEGTLKTIDAEHAGESVSGSYSFPGDDGQTYSVQYTADENGYHPVGEHLPTPPPVPAAIARALEYLATAPPQTDESH